MVVMAGGSRGVLGRDSGDSEGLRVQVELKDVSMGSQETQGDLRSVSEGLQEISETLQVLSGASQRSQGCFREFKGISV